MGLKLSYYPYTVNLRHTFTTAVYSRTSTPVVLTELEYEGIIGYGEASLPQYLGESHDTVAAFLNSLNLDQFDDPFEVESILDYVDTTAPKNTAAKASVDIALHDLIGKLLNKPLYKIFGFDKEKAPLTSYTIGLDSIEKVIEKVIEAKEHKILKIKLGGDNDREIIETIRMISNIPLTIDANQGWTDKQEALDMIFWLKEKNVLFIEQPMPKEMLDENAWLTQHSPLPTIADESFQRLKDIQKIYGAFSGINIKLMKSTGIREALEMIHAARALSMKVMIGCMTETSCAISAASQLCPAVDWADLDGALLISNDCFQGTKIVEGKIVLNDLPGIGVKKLIK